MYKLGTLCYNNYMQEIILTKEQENMRLNRKEVEKVLGPYLNPAIPTINRGSHLWKQFITTLSPFWEDPRYKTDTEFRCSAMKEGEAVFSKLFPDQFIQVQDPKSLEYNYIIDRREGDFILQGIGKSGYIYIDLKVSSPPYYKFPGSIAEKSFKDFKPDHWYLCCSCNGKIFILVNCSFIHTLIKTKELYFEGKEGHRYISGKALLIIADKYSNTGLIFKLEA